MEYSDGELEAYLDEELNSEEMAALEAELRSNQALGEKLAAINARRDAGVHSVGEIWRRHRISCPTREQLGTYLLGVADKDVAEYLTFHIEAIGCRYCRANLEDLKMQHEEATEVVKSRRTKYFQSSAGYLRK